MKTISKSHKKVPKQNLQYAEDALKTDEELKLTHAGKTRKRYVSSSHSSMVTV
jgi:hypothetical protein